MKRIKRICSAVALAALAATASGEPAATEPVQISAEDLLAELQKLNALDALATRPTANPSNFGVTGGFGLPRGALALSLSYTDERPSPQKDEFITGDGSAGAAIGFGDPYDLVGLDLLLGVVSVGDGPGEDGTLGVRLHRVLPGFVAGGRSSVSIGVDNGVQWGDASETENYSGAFSTVLPMSSGVSTMLTVGYGSNASRDDGDPDGGVFGSIGLGWNPYINTTAAWTADELLLTAGFKPFLNRNLMVTAGAGDVTDELDNRRFLLTVSWFTQNLF